MALPKGWKSNKQLYVGNITKQPAPNSTPKSNVNQLLLEDDCYDCENETMNRVSRGSCPDIQGGMVSPVISGQSKNPCPPKDSEIEELITEAEVDDVKTAGLSQVPTFIWYLLGGVAVLYIAKKNKIIKL